MRNTSIQLLAATTAFFLGALSPTASQAADFRVCADPQYLPFSNRAGDGFENQVAAYAAKALGERLVYAWADSRGPEGYDAFLRDTLDAKKCDVVIDVPYASDNVLTSNPYYVSSYVFVFAKSKHLDITSMDSPALKGLRIGFEADTPAENGLKLRTLILHGVPFDTGSGSGASPAAMLDAVASGKIAVGVTWEPAIGMFLRTRPALQIVAVPNSRSQGSPEQYAFPMAMGVRRGDNATREKLNRLIGAHAAELTRILARNGVKLYKPDEVAAQ